ncbi:ABC transporter ATP-binding protein [Pseudomonadales bacterium]|nr:ABC transporter ATP-binding protein [Pseudomonadales bacterium]
MLVIVSAFAEVVSIGAVLPFLAVLTAPERLFEHSVLRPFIEFMGINSPSGLLLPMTLLFGSAAVMAGGIRLLLIWASTHLSFITGADIGLRIYRRTLYQSYSVHVARNSSEVINGITRKADSVINQTILPILNCVSYGVILLSILTILVAISPMVALGSFGSFGFFYVCIMLWNRKSLQKDSQGVAVESTRVVKALQEGLGGIRDVLIDGSQSVYSDAFQKSDRSLRKSQANIVFIGSSPRFALEALGMVGIATLAYFLVLQPGGIDDAIPILGGLAVGAQRLLPALQGMYGGWVNMKGGKESLRDALDLLEQPLPEYAGQARPDPIQFTDLLELQNVSFRYSQHEPWALQNINLQVSKGQRIGIIGASGGGKSTLIDIIMGLLVPSNGHIEIDGQSVGAKNVRAWQTHIAHVPQNIYLSDASIRENIAFGVSLEEIDDNRVYEAAKKASLSVIIEKMEDGYETFVGERGARLSGGQRQRIGIARALYKNADVLVFDEATSALDGVTEREVMSALDGLDNDLTILMIAHRLSTLAGCDKIIEIENGSIARIDSYEEIVMIKN